MPQPDKKKAQSVIEQNRVSEDFIMLGFLAKTLQGLNMIRVE
jgi:hypothetical protein